jgi:hypothetical protein
MLAREASIGYRVPARILPDAEATDEADGQPLLKEGTNHGCDQNE